jgi:hypothetical protein
MEVSDKNGFSFSLSFWLEKSLEIAHQQKKKEFAAALKCFRVEKFIRRFKTSEFQIAHVHENCGKNGEEKTFIRIMFGNIFVIFCHNEC